MRLLQKKYLRFTLLLVATAMFFLVSTLLKAEKPAAKDEKKPEVVAPHKVEGTSSKMDEPTSTNTETAKDGSESKEKKSFNAGEMIIGHIADNHEWHLWGEGEHAVAIPLPVILYSSGKGFSIFSSSHFEDGKSYQGYRIIDEEFVKDQNLDHNKYINGNIVAVDENGKLDTTASAGIWDLSITKNVASLFIGVFLILFIILSVAKSYVRNKETAPKGMQSMFEPIIVFVRDDIAKNSIGEKHYKRFMPFLLTVFFFILINNLLGLIPIFPGGANLTGNIAIPMTLAVCTFVIMMANTKKHYWRHTLAMPGIPIGVLFILTPIEILGIFLKPFVLMIRLFANMLAGHIVALSFFAMIFIFAEKNIFLGYGVSIMSIAFTIFMTLLDLLVSFLQAYVFTLLSAMYFGMALEESHDH